MRLLAVLFVCLAGTASAVEVGYVGVGDAPWLTNSEVVFNVYVQELERGEWITRRAIFGLPMPIASGGLPIHKMPDGRQWRAVVLVTAGQPYQVAYGPWRYTRRWRSVQRLRPKMIVNVQGR